MASKPQSQAFTQSWDKTVAWAKSHNIPFQAYYPVYQMDVQKFTSGYAMSEADRINAIEAAAGLSATTALPTPSPTDVLGNIGRNAGDIFTGLNPFGAGGGLIGNILNTVKNTVEHPSSAYNGALDIGKILNPLSNQQQTKNAINAFDAQVLSPHDILSWIPGLSDAAQLTSGKGEQLALNPLTSLLDILPLGKTLPKELATSSHADAIASKLGVTKDELGKMDAIQFGYRWAKTMPVPGGGKTLGALYDAAGQAIGFQPLKIGERINLFRNNKGMGSDQAELLKGQVIKGDKGTDLLMQKVTPIFDAIKSLPKEQRLLAFKAIQKDIRPITDKLNDDRYPEQVKQVLSTIHDYNQQDLEIKMAAGDAQVINTQFGPETYSTKPGANGPIVARAFSDSDSAQTTLDTASKGFDALAYRVLNADRKMAGAMDTLGQNQQAVFNAIRDSDPAVAAISHTAGAGLNDILWKKVVETQSPLVRNLLGLYREPKGQTLMPARARSMFPTMGQDIKLTLHHANSLRDLFSPGGLLDQMVKAYNEHDWVSLSKYSRVAKRKFDAKVYEHIPIKGQTAFLSKVKNLTNEVHDYAVSRERDSQAMEKMMYGTHDPRLIARGKFTPKSIAGLTAKAAKAHNHALEMAIKHPPDVWSNVAMDILVDKMLEPERVGKMVDAGVKYLGDHGLDKTELEKIRTNPRTLIELFVRASKDSFGNGMMPDIDVSVMNELRDNMFNELASLRAMGHEPEYVPMISSFDAEKLAREGYNVYIGSLRPKSISSTFGRAFEFNGSVYNIAMGLMKDAKEQITRDMEKEYYDEYFSKHLHESSLVNQQVTSYVLSEIRQEAERAASTGVHETPVDAIVAQQIKRSGLISYDPQSIFGEGFSVPKLQGEYYIDKNMASAVKQGVEKWQFPAQGIMDKGTKVFRFSILQMSPRFTAHILVGGTALVAYRGHASMLLPSTLRAAGHVFRTGKLPDDILEKYPNAAEHMVTAATQEGIADRAFHSAAGFSMGNKVIQEFMDNHQMTANVANWMKAAGTINQRFTRAIVRGQRAVVFLDGVRTAEKTGHVTELVPVKQLDEHGNEVLDPITQKPVWVEEEQRHEMTPEQAQKAGMEAVSQVMGDLRHMTPLERQVFVRAFPFYGWTKHVLTYVLTYPIDHPYRATFLSQLATQNSEDIASGLPTRIQLLTLLGTPDAYGNVSAIDTRVFDPLRDTANYASITGIFQSLNPVLSALPAYVDPQIVFGGNDLYPNVSYSQLYGVKQSGPQGNAYTVAEQFVPEVSALDQAFNLSGQYAYLKAQGGNSFSKKIFESLNVPFFQVQHINLRQLAAQNEIDRFNIAKNDALQAAQTGDMSSLAGYAPDALIPDPLNNLYNVTPAYIAAMNKESESKYGLPMYQTTPPPPNPPL